MATEQPAPTAVITVACRLHGETELPADAVYLRLKSVAASPDGVQANVWCALALCEGHVMSWPVSPTGRAALAAAGALVIDEPTAILMLRLTSPCDAALASRALSEIEDLALLRRHAAIQAGHHWLTAADDAGRQHAVVVATAMKGRIGALRDERGAK